MNSEYSKKLIAFDLPDNMLYSEDNVDVLCQLFSGLLILEVKYSMSKQANVYVAYAKFAPGLQPGDYPTPYEITKRDGIWSLVPSPTDAQRNEGYKRAYEDLQSQLQCCKAIAEGTLTPVESCTSEAMKAVSLLRKEYVKATVR